MLTVDPKCDCEGWNKSADQIHGAQVLAALHSAQYTGDRFKFCPWCGGELRIIKPPTTPGNIPVPVPQCPDCVVGTGYICKMHRGHHTWEIGDEVIETQVAEGYPEGLGDLEEELTTPIPGYILDKGDPEENLKGFLDIAAGPLLKPDGTPHEVEDDAIVIVQPHGAMGRSSEDDLLEAGLRAIAEAASENSKEEWAAKYGTNFENFLFVMRRYCWCEKDECKVCSGEFPNFRYKTSDQDLLDFEVEWYKYIGRGMEVNKELTPHQTAVMIADCLNSIARGAS